MEERMLYFKNHYDGKCTGKILLSDLHIQLSFLNQHSFQKSIRFHQLQLCANRLNLSLLIILFSDLKHMSSHQFRVPVEEQELLTNPSGAPEFTLVFCGFVLINLRFSVYCVVDHYLSSCPFFIWSLYCLSFDLLLLFNPCGIFKLVVLA